VPPPAYFVNVVPLVAAAFSRRLAGDVVDYGWNLALRSGEALDDSELPIQRGPNFLRPAGFPADALAGGAVPERRADIGAPPLHV
jgi:hypothetical protein